MPPVLTEIRFNETKYALDRTGLTDTIQYTNTVVFGAIQYKVVTCKRHTSTIQYKCFAGIQEHNYLSLKNIWIQIYFKIEKSP